jgi:hypothetical protein
MRHAAEFDLITPEKIGEPGVEVVHQGDYMVASRPRASTRRERQQQHITAHCGISATIASGRISYLNTVPLWGQFLLRLGSAHAEHFFARLSHLIACNGVAASRHVSFY